MSNDFKAMVEKALENLDDFSGDWSKLTKALYAANQRLEQDNAALREELTREKEYFRRWYAGEITKRGTLTDEWV